MSCKCHQFNDYNCCCNKLDNNENKDEPFKHVLNFNPQQLYNSSKNIQDNNMNSVNINNEITMKEENVIKSSEDNETKNDWSHLLNSILDSYGHTIHEPINTGERKNENLENIYETNRKVDSVAEVPNLFEDNNELSEISSISDESNESGLSFYYDPTNYAPHHTDIDFIDIDFNKEQNDINNIDIKPFNEEKERQCVQFSEKNKKKPSEDTSKFFDTPHPSFKLQEKQNYDKTDGPTEKGENFVYHLEADSAPLQTNSIEQENKINNCYESNNNIKSDKKESEGYINKNCDIISSISVFQKSSGSEILNHSSSLSNNSNSKELSSLNNILDYSKNNILNLLSDNNSQYLNINLGDVSFASLSCENNNLNNLIELNRTVDYLFNKKRKREKEKIFEIEKKKKSKMKNTKTFLDISINRNKINNTFIIKPKNIFNILENSKIENIKNKNINKTFYNIFDKNKNKNRFLKGKTERVMKEICKYKNRLYENVRSLYREFQNYLSTNKEKFRLNNDFLARFIYKKFSSYPHSLIKEFFSKNCICDLYEQFLADTNFHISYLEKNVKLKNKIMNEEKKGDYSYEKCRKNFHKIFNENYNQNDLKFNDSNLNLVCDKII